MDAYTLGYKYRIYPNQAQQDVINQTLGCARFVYNHFLACRRDEWNLNHSSIKYKETSAMLTDLKRYEEYRWLKNAESSALQQALRDLENAYEKFFQKKAGYPNFKSKHAYEQSYRSQMTNGNIGIVGNRIKLPKAGLVKAKLSRSFEGRILNVTVSRTASGKYFVSLCVEVDRESLVQPNAGGQIGLDVGLKDFYTDSEGKSTANPRTLKSYAKKLAREQKRLSRKMPRSKNREKQRVRVARIHERVGNIRKDFLQKLSTELVRINQLIAIEDLNIKGMLKNHKLAKSISDVSWSKFFTLLEYKAPLHGCRIVRIPPLYPSSQTCSSCGYQNPLTKDLSVRDWICPECGVHHDRDGNAAKNILAKALEIAG